MRKFLLSLTTFVLMAGTMMAQNPKMARQDAYLAYQDYQRDTKGGTKYLLDAKSKIDIAAADATIAGELKTWLYKGMIYSELSNNPLTKVQYPDLSMEVSDAYLKAIQLDEKKKSRSEIQTGVLSVIGQLYNAAGDAFNNKSYIKAYERFNRVVESRNKLVAYMDNKLTDEEMNTALGNDITKSNLFTDAALYAANSANLAGKPTEAEALYKSLLSAKGISDARVADIYSNLFDLYKESDKDKAMGLLKEGRQKFPKNQDLLIKSIQVALEEGRLAEVETDLVAAIDNDPKNVSLQFALATVYDGLAKGYNEKADKSNYEQFFEKAKTFYDRCIATDAKFGNAYFNLGALYYNHGVYLNNEIENITDTKVYTAKKKELQPSIDAAYNSALPNFLKAEELMPNEASLLGAIRDIYVRLDNEEKSSEYSKKYKAAAGQ